MTTATAGAMDSNESCGGRLVATDGRALPLKESRLKADAKGGVARVVLEQRFENPYDDPLAVTYLLPLPSDGAVSGFAFRVGERRIVGEVDRKKAARERYEQALMEGRSAALVEQDRTSLFTQEIGNIPPRQEVVAEITLDQRLVWLNEGAWEWRFPTAVAPRYQGAPGRVADTGKLAVDVADGPTGARLFVNLTLRDASLEGHRPESPSHAMRFVSEAGRVLAGLVSESGEKLDRDVVVRWKVAQPAVGLSLETARAQVGKPLADGAFGLLTVVPPRPERQGKPVPRDLIVLLDTSGSMGGEPLCQAKRIVGALIDSLGPQDQVELIEFSSEPRRWKRKALEASDKVKRKAIEWLNALEAGGGTEMREGIFEALNPLRHNAQRQVVLVTDGLIGFESEVVGAILKGLPQGSRLHTVGVGSAVNRSLTGPAARAGRGLEVVVGLGEDPERAAKRLLARTELPLVTDLVVEGSAVVEHAPARLPDLFAGSPVLIGLCLRPEGGTLTVRGRTAEGEFKERLEVRAVDFGAGTGAAVALFGREKVEDLETKLAGGDDRQSVDHLVEKLGLDFQISTRLTSWIAVSDQRDVDPLKPTRREKMPHELPYGMSAEGLGLRQSMAAMPSMKTMAGTVMPGAMPAMFRSRARPAPAPMARQATGDLDEPASPAEQMEDEGSAEQEVAQRVMESAPDMDRLAVDDKPGPAGAMALKGRLVLRKGRDLVLELTVDARGLHWEPERTITLTFEDGSVLTAQLVLERTTAPMSVAAGQVVRLAVLLDADAPESAPMRAALMCAGQALVVEVA